MLPHEGFDNGKNYDICFMQIQNETTAGQPTVKFLSWVKRLKENGCKVISWTGDIRATTPQWMIDFAPYVSITAFSNQRDVDYCRSLGIKSEFLQIGIDDRIFTPIGEKIPSPEIVFLANNYGNQFPLGQYRREVVQYLSSRYGSKFGVYGNGWSNPSGNLNSDQNLEAALYRNAKVAISVSHFNVDRYTSDRLFRALGCGIATLVHEYPNMETDLSTFTNLQQLGDHIDKLLSDDNYRAIYGKQCHDESKKFTYDVMVKNIIEL